MRILIAVQHFPPNYVGGVEIYTEWVARNLAKRGHQIFVVALEDMERSSGPPIEYTESLQADGITVFRLSMLEKDYWTFESSIYHEDIAGWFGGKLREIKPDIVHVQSGYRLSAAPIAAALAYGGARIVVSLHDYWYICPSVNLLRDDNRHCSGVVTPEECVRCTRGTHANAMRGNEDWMARTDPEYLAKMSVRSELMRDLLRHVDVALSPTRYLADTYENAGFAFRDLRVARYGLERKVAAPRRRPWTDADPPVIGFISALLYHKGAHVLMEAMKQLDSAGFAGRCLIYGSTSSQSKYSDMLIDRYGNNRAIEFMGAYRAERLGDMLSEMDIVVIPSIWPENFPLVGLEALSSKTPIIASDTGGLAELVSHRVNGLLFQPANPDALADCIREAFSSEAFLDRLSEGAAYDKSSDEEGEELVALYLNLLAQ